MSIPATVNIANLPQVQNVANTDFLIIQTSNGTRTIMYNNLNVIRTDSSGNTTNIQNITAHDTVLSSVYTSTITASNYNTKNGPGITLPVNYYDKFTLQNGIVLSAIPTSIALSNNPIYTNYSSQLTSFSASFNTSKANSYTQLSVINTAIQTTSANLYTIMESLTTVDTYSKVLSAGKNVQLRTGNTLFVNTSGCARAWVTFGISSTGLSSYSPTYSGAPPGYYPGQYVTSNYIFNSYNVAAVQYISTGIYKIIFKTGTYSSTMPTSAYYPVLLISTSIAAGNTPSIHASNPNYALPINMTFSACEVVNGSGTQQNANPGYFGAVFF
jgi:hypothetical protein